MGKYSGLCFSSFSLIPRLLQKIWREKAQMTVIASIWPTQMWFSVALWMTVQQPLNLPKGCLTLPQDPLRKHSLNQTLRFAAILSGTSSDAQTFWSTLPKLSYNHGALGHTSSIAHITRDGCYFATPSRINPVQPSINGVLEFLYNQYSLGIGYSALNTARSALPSFISINNVPVGQIPIICCFMKGIFNERPALPKYDITWDVNIVLHYLKSLSPVSTIPIMLLSHKLVMLLILLSGQHGQTVHLV